MRNSDVARHTVLNLFGSIVPNIIGFITVPLYFHLIGPERFGVLSIAWLFLGYFGLFDLGLGRATAFRIAALRDAAPAERARTFWTAVLVNIGLGAIGGAGLWLAGAVFFGRFVKVAANLRPEMIAGVPYLAAAVPVATLAGVLSGALVGREKFLSTNLVSTISTLFFQIFPIIVAVRYGPHLPLLLCSAIFARGLALGVLMLMCHRELARGYRPRIDRREIRTLLNYGVWVTLAGLAAPVLIFADRFAIGAIFGAAAVATYTVPFQVAQRIDSLPKALATALFPKSVPATAAENARMSRMMTLTLASVLSFPVLVAVILLRPFLNVWVGPEIAEQAAGVGRLLLLGFWLNAFAYVPSLTLQATGRPGRVAQVLILQIPAYLLALYFGMSWFGLLGCGLVFCLRNAVDWLLLTWVAQRNFGGWHVVAMNLALLVIGTLLVDLAPGGWAQYSGLTITALLTLALGWSAAPEQLKALVVARLRLWRSEAIRA